MVPHVAPRIADCFVDLVDPRINRTKRHALLDIITIALCGVICGAESWVEVADWGEAKREWLRPWLELPNGIPSHDTFGRVFGLVDPMQFETGFLRWVQGVAVATAGAVLAIDGKTIRAARPRRSALAHRQRMGERQPAGDRTGSRRSEKQ